MSQPKLLFQKKNDLKVHLVSPIALFFNRSDNSKSHPGLRNLRIGRVQLISAHTTRHSALFIGDHCLDSDLSTLCRPDGIGPNAIALEIVEDFEVSVKSVTIYTPKIDVQGYDPSEHDIKVGIKIPS